jgi:hypothetical protein
MMLEASRLARNNSDWYRLIEICGLTRTLIADENAIYKTNCGGHCSQSKHVFWKSGGLTKV